jgi:hypothetical protein
MSLDRGFGDAERYRDFRNTADIDDGEQHAQLGRGQPPAQDGRRRLWAKGLAFSRKLMRTGVPGSSKNSRSELTR